MKDKNRRGIYAAAGMLAAFVLWTLEVCLIDVRPIGPNGSTVGFASFNLYVHGLTGVHLSLYRITDWMSLVPVMFGIGFALLGLDQWIRRKHISKVDRSLLILGGFYAVVMAVYAFLKWL